MEDRQIIFLETNHIGKLMLVQCEVDELYGVSGIYILADRENILYIGKSVNIGHRLTRNHHVYNRNIENIFIVQEKYERAMFAIETELIKMYSPSKNIRGVSR